MPKRGGSKGRKKASLYDLSRQFLQPKHKKQYLKELLGESDRAAALVAAADVEAYLAHLLMLKFTRLSDSEREKLFFRPNAPLSEFANRIAVAYGLGLLHKDEREDLDCIRRVRNAFAHAVIPVNFETDVVAKECSLLHYRNIYGDESSSFGQPKYRYLLTALSLRQVLLDRAFETVKETASSIGDDNDKAQFLSELNALMKPDT